MEFYRSQIMVCGGTGCTSSNSLQIIDKLEKQIAEKGLDKEIKVVRTGCFGLCEAGPVVIVYPEGVFYSHVKPEDVDEIVERVYRRVLSGMGLIVLHSGHASKLFQKLCGTDSGCLKWREDGEKEILWAVDPGHPIVAGLEEKMIIQQEEMYGEHFNIPQPDEQVFISWFEGGEVFRSGCCWHRGKGKVFYFRPGHEAFPVYYQPEIQKVIINAVKWAVPTDAPEVVYGNTAPVVPFVSHMEGKTIQGLHEKK